ncbi:septation protein SepH [Parafrankia discariae]|uniref:septation protein SepH n=1 Tax=Parafrankia discariae TaxID=365528 RepID=UPI0003766642|nr:septation protein SepH [Parafrankia discariae]
MRELRAVALSEDGGYLVLADAAGRSDAEQFRVAVDDRLRAALRGARRSEVRAESALTPREIQARLRAGETAADVARAAGIPVERVERYEGPVLAERARVVQEARAALLPKDPGGVPGRPLGEVVDARLLSVQDNPDTAQWDAWRRVDGIWLVQLTSDSRCARWTWDPVVRRVRPHDDAARALVAPESAEPPAPQPAQPPVRAAGPALTLVHDQGAAAYPTQSTAGGPGQQLSGAQPATAPPTTFPAPAAVNGTGYLPGAAPGYGPSPAQVPAGTSPDHRPAERAGDGDDYAPDHPAPGYGAPDYAAPGQGAAGREGPAGAAQDSSARDITGQDGATRADGTDQAGRDEPQGPVSAPAQSSSASRTAGAARRSMPGAWPAAQGGAPGLSGRHGGTGGRRAATAPSRFGSRERAVPPAAPADEPRSLPRPGAEYPEETTAVDAGPANEPRFTHAGPASPELTQADLVAAAEAAFAPESAAADIPSADIPGEAARTAGLDEHDEDEDEFDEDGDGDRPVRGTAPAGTGRSPAPAPAGRPELRPAAIVPPAAEQAQEPATPVEREPRRPAAAAARRPAVARTTGGARSLGALAAAAEDLDGRAAASAAPAVGGRGAGAPGRGGAPRRPAAVRATPARAEDGPADRPARSGPAAAEQPAQPATAADSELESTARATAATADDSAAEASAEAAADATAEAATEAAQQATRTAQQAAAGNRGRQPAAGRGGERPAGGRRGRKSVPAWDDIVFGARRP